MVTPKCLIYTIDSIHEENFFFFFFVKSTFNCTNKLHFVKTRTAIEMALLGRINLHLCPAIYILGVYTAEEGLHDDSCCMTRHATSVVVQTLLKSL